jgi:hypothetical protein
VVALAGERVLDLVDEPHCSLLCVRGAGITSTVGRPR